MSRPRSRFGALREVLVFQFKLALDAVRDLAISPLSWIAAAVDFVFPNGPRWFYRVLALGRRSEEIIRLWHIPGDAPESPDEIAARLQQLEDWLRQEATSTQNREAIRAWALRMGNRLNFNGRPPPALDVPPAQDEPAPPPER
ncbi:MAG: hypothetical protein KDI56_10190 [Xanthomonadales bacterium]|nr:hypothetical protein [Xanthomonadales bacterium]